MNGYDLSRQWFSFAYENTEAKPIHTALYFWIVERANASGWKKIIDIQTEKSMDCLGVTDWRTYKNALQFLADHNFIAWVEKSKNQYTCNRISIVLKEGEACESFRNAYAQNAEPHAEAIAEAIAEAYAEPVVEAIAEALQSYINLKTNKPINPKTSKPKDDLKEIENLFESFRGNYPGSKRGLKTELDNFKKKHPNYRDIIPTLPDILEKQIAYREERRKAGGFVPEWPMLATYINQKRWEMEVSHSKNLPQQPAQQPAKIGSIRETVRRQEARR